MNICTWRKADYSCKEEAKHAMKANDGEIWAILCDEHEEMLRTAIESGNIPKLMAYYVCAQGGPARAASRMTGRAENPGGEKR